MPKLLIFFLLAYSATISSLKAETANSDAQNYYDLGVLYYQKGSLEDAKEAFEKYLSLNPKSEKTKQYLILIEREQKEVPSDTQENIPKTEKGAWVIPKGKLYAEIYNKYYWHKSQFDDKGKNTEWAYGGRYREFRSELKLEYGLTDRLTILTYLPFKEAHWEDDYKKATTRNLVDIWSGIKYNFFTKPVVFTLQGRAKFPTNYNPNHTPSLGREQIDTEIKFLFGKSLWPIFNGYTKWEFGFRARDEEPTNEIPYFYELGYNLLEWFTLKATIDGIEGISGTGKIDEDYTKYNAGIIFKLFDKYNIETGYGQTFDGKNSSAAQEIILSVSTQF